MPHHLAGPFHLTSHSTEPTHQTCHCCSSGFFATDGPANFDTGKPTFSGGGDNLSRLEIPQRASPHDTAGQCHRGRKTAERTPPRPPTAAKPPHNAIVFRADENTLLPLPGISPQHPCPLQPRTGPCLTGRSTGAHSYPGWAPTASRSSPAIDAPALRAQCAQQKKRPLSSTP